MLFNQNSFNSLTEAVETIAGPNVPVSIDKLRRNAAIVISGIILGSTFNKIANPKYYLGNSSPKNNEFTLHRSLSSSFDPMSLPETIS